MPLHLAAPVAIGAPAKKPFKNPFKADAKKTAARKAWAAAAAKARATNKADPARSARGAAAFSKALANIKKAKGVQGLY